MKSALSRWQLAREVGFTLVEILIVVAILGIVATIAVTAGRNAYYQAKITHAIGDIKTIDAELVLYYTTNQRWPDALAEVGLENLNDPWGNAYQYRNVQTQKGNGKLRKDRFMVPLNSDFDLYSRGADGLSRDPLSAPASHDDIIRANDGGYVGLASSY